jgi:hypothetical protein
MSLTTLSNAAATDEMRYEVLKKIGIKIKDFRKLTPAAKNDLLFKAMFEDMGSTTVNNNQPTFQRTVIVQESFTTSPSAMEVDLITSNKKRKRN